MNHKIAYEEINYENIDYELDVWSSCFNPIFNPPPEVIEDGKNRSLHLKILLFISQRME